MGVVLGFFIGVMWLEEAIDQLFFHGALDRYGIEPRSVEGLRGIPLAPFLHGNFNHLMGNTLPLVVLGYVVMIRRKRDLLWVSILSQLVGGLGVWLIGGANTLHFGASMLVFGYIGYLGSRGIFERRLWPILGSVVVLFLYGSLLWGMLPGDPSVSWEGHLFGFLGGTLAARILRRRPTVGALRAAHEAAPTDEKKPPPSKPPTARAAPRAQRVAST